MATSGPLDSSTESSDSSHSATSNSSMLWGITCVSCSMTLGGSLSSSW